jgi:hypothetical protein
MDVRSGVFDLIARDVVLGAVGVTHIDCGQSGNAAAKSGFVSCSLVLEWATNDQEGGPADSHLLTVWVHLPRQRSSEHPFLEFLLQRVRAVLLTGAADGSITSEYRGMSRDVVASSSVDTISISNRFRITVRQPRHEGMTLLGLVPWAGADRDAVWFGALSGAAQTVN